jgi:imidazolonepropionase-like amidohydrolase
MRSRLVFNIALGLIVLLLRFDSNIIGQSRSASEPRLALVGGTIYTDPSAEPIRNGVIIIGGGKIVEIGDRSLKIPGGVKTLDCTGMAITAGFWNSHVHFIERKWADVAKIPATELSEQLQAMLTQFGFTSVFDTGSMWENTRRIRDRVESGEIPGPRIRSTGEIIYPKGGSPKQEILDLVGAMRLQLPEAADAAEAAAASKKLLDAGVDGVKLYAATWYPPFVALPENAIQAAVSEAHRIGKPVFAHPTNRDALLAAVRSGVDVLVHTTPQSGPWDDTILSSMKQGGVALIPTLKLWKDELRHERISVRDGFVNNGVGQLKAWAASGGVTLFGTDVGYIGDYDPSDEYILMAAAGMSYRQILASLTTAPAERFGESKQRGRIVAGYAADLVILNRDPSMDLRALASVRYTIRNGVLIYSK